MSVPPCMLTDLSPSLYSCRGILGFEQLKLWDVMALKGKVAVNSPQRAAGSPLGVPELVPDEAAVLLGTLGLGLREWPAARVNGAYF